MATHTDADAALPVCLKRLIAVPNDTCEFMTLITLIRRNGDKVVMRMVHAITCAALVPVGLMHN